MGTVYSGSMSWPESEKLSSLGSGRICGEENNLGRKLPLLRRRRCTVQRTTDPPNTDVPACRNTIRKLSQNNCAKIRLVVALGLSIVAQAIWHALLDMHLNDGYHMYTRSMQTNGEGRS